jgi:hypothetical protein
MEAVMRKALVAALLAWASVAGAHTVPTAGTDCRIYDAHGHALNADEMSHREFRQVLACERKRSLADPAFRAALELKITNPELFR